MEKNVNTKEFITNFPKFRKQVQKGSSFIIHWRSRPVGKFIPYQEKEEKQKKPFNWEEFKNKYVMHTKDRKPFSAVELIRKDRGYDK